MPKFSVRILDKQGEFFAYLTHKNRGSWSKRVAREHGKDYCSRWPGYSFVLEEE